MLITTHDTSVDSPAYMQREEPEIWYISWHISKERSVAYACIEPV